MTVLIVIHYISNDNKVMRRGSFPLGKRKVEEVALDFWKWIKKEHPYECVIEKIIADGEDITDLIKKLESTNIN
jgi:hypothetical protein